MFTQTAGFLTLAGALTTSSFTFSGGTISGQVQLSSSSGNSTLTLGSSLGSGSGSFLFNGNGTAAINGVNGAATIPSGTTVTLQPAGGFLNVTNSFTAITNNGSLIADSSNGGAVIISADLTNNGTFTVSGPSILNPSNAIADLVNENAGVVNINAPYSYGALTNYATINIAAGQSLTNAGLVAPFTQGGGTLNILGTLSAQNFSYGGGTINIPNGTLNVPGVLKVLSTAPPLNITGGNTTVSILDLSGVPGNFHFTGGSLALTGAPVYIDSAVPTGASTVGNSLTIATGMNLTVSGGNNELLGAFGTGTITQTGGTHVASTLNIGVFNTGSGSYALSGTGNPHGGHRET